MNFGPVVNRRSTLRQCVVVDNCASLELPDGTRAIAGQAWGVSPEFAEDGAVYRDFFRLDGRTRITLLVVVDDE